MGCFNWVMGQGNREWWQKMGKTRELMVVGMSGEPVGNRVF